MLVCTNYDVIAKLWNNPISAIRARRRLIVIFRFSFLVSDGDAEGAISIESCNNIQDYPLGKRLYKHLQTLPMFCTQFPPLSMGGACYHMDTELNNDQVTFFPGHIDKPFVHSAVFLPLGYTPFFTLIAVPVGSEHLQDEPSLTSFLAWLERLSGDDLDKATRFLQLFDAEAKQHNNDSPQTRLIYLNKVGSVLSFPANRYYHATITPKKPKGYPRDLLVLHPLDGTSS